MAARVETPRDELTGLILAGGRGQRMGGRDKGWVTVAGKPMIAYTVRALRARVGRILINANRNLARYEALGYRVVPDRRDGFQGPLAGFASGLDEARSPFLVTVPCDSPLVGPDVVDRLYRTLIESDAELCTASDGERLHPVFCLLRTELGPSLEAYLESGERKIDRWFDMHRAAVADFSQTPWVFTNINRPEDLAEVESRLKGMG